MITDVHVIGCGDSGINYDGHLGYSIGVNDCEKFGIYVDELILVNPPKRFSEERLKTILDSEPGHIFSHQPGDWQAHFKQPVHELPLSPFVGRVKPGIIYKSKTSPFIAISRAFSLGAEEIIIYGVDMITHPVFSVSAEAGRREFDQYKRLIDGIREYGVKVYLGSPESALKEFVDVKPLI